MEYKAVVLDLDTDPLKSSIFKPIHFILKDCRCFVISSPFMEYSLINSARYPFT